MISFDASLHNHLTLKINCKAVGQTPKAQVERMLNVLRKCQSVVHFSNFYQGLLREQTAASFPNKDWNDIGVKIQIVDEESQSQYPELMIYMKPWVLFGVVDLDVVDIDALKDDVVRFKRVKQYFIQKRAQDERSKLVRILLLNGKEEFFSNMEQEKQYIIVPPLPEDKLSVYLEDQLQIFLSEIIQHFASEIQRLKSDSSSLVLFNMREEKISDQSKLKKRRLGRQYKVMGDLSLLILSTTDALNYYKSALEILKKNDDQLWLATAHEALASVKFFERGVHEEIEEHFREALIQFKKTKFTTLEIECFFKLMQFRKDSNDKVGLNKTVNLFLKTFDPESPPDKCKFYVFVSDLYGAVGMLRKQAFFLKLSANFISSINRPLCERLMKTTANLYGIGELFGGKNKLFWPSMQLNLAEEIYNLTYEQQEKNAFLVQMVQMFYDQYPPARVMQIFQQLNQESIYSQKNATVNLSLLPQMVRLNLKAVKHTFRKAQAQNEKASTDVFIVNPWAKKKKTLEAVYPAQSLIEFVVTLDNQFMFDFFLDTGIIDFEGVECLNYPSSILIPAGAKNYEVTLTLRPLEQGNLKIKGVFVTFLNFEYHHPCDDKGFFFPVKTNEALYDLHNIKILPEMPELKVSVNREHVPNMEVDMVIFDETEVFSYQLVVENLSPKPIKNVRYDLCIECENPPIYDYKTKLDITLDEYQSLTFILVEDQYQNLLEDNETKIITIPNLKHPCRDIKKITLIMYFQFDENSEYEREVKILRLVRINQQISIQQCRFITKYQVEDKENTAIREIHDLQDSCYLSLELIKQQQDELINLSLTSAILLEGSFVELMAEDMSHFSKVIKLRKLKRSQITQDSADLYVIWKNLFRNTVGLLRPFSKLSVEDLKKHCCKDLFEVEAHETNSSGQFREIKYSIVLPDFVPFKVELSVLGDAGFHQNSSKSMLSSVAQDFEIVSGTTSFIMEAIEHSDIIQVYYPVQAKVSWGIQVELQDLANGVGYIKRCQIK